MPPPQAHPILEFGDFELDTLRRVLVSRADGKPVEITGRVIDALVYLVERPGELVEKKALMEALWPHVIVEEGNLTQTIHTLRRVLGEKRGEHRYIATVPGRGYRFVAEVKVREPRQPAPGVLPPARPRRPLAWAAGAAALLIGVAVIAWQFREPPAQNPVAAQASIAVLPFVDMSAEQDQAHFAEGLSEEILNLLARADALRVIARTSSFSFKDQNVDIGTIARRLGVSHVLEGSVRRSGPRMRITAQLIDGATSAHLWSDTFDRDVNDIFGVQREIAAAVADALHLTLRHDAPTRADTRSPEAYDHYLQGRHLFLRRSEGDVLQAKAHFERAVQIDPDYARAWAGLAGVYLVARYEGIELPEAMQNWRHAAERAIALAPNLAEAHVRAANYLFHAGEEKAAQEHIARAMELDPQEPLLRGRMLMQLVGQGRLDEALELQRGVVATDPLAAVHRGNLGSLLMIVDRLPEAQEELERALELSPAGVNTLGSLADVLILQGRTEEALKVAARLPEGFQRHERLALAAFARGDEREGEAMLGRLLAEANGPTPDWQVMLATAEVYAATRDPDRAFHWLDTALRYSRRHPGQLPRVVLRDNLHVAPHFKPLHADPRWKKLLAEVS